MLYCHQIHLRLRAGIGFSSICLRVTAVIVLAFVLPVLANGYTVVMRGGHRIEIPDRFQVTDTALTYEASAGIFVTLQLTSIDIVATDETNGSQPGTLLRRIRNESERQAPTVTHSSASRATRTLTNRDLEQFRLSRLEGEAEYEIRRKELGWPSREETNRRRQEESVWAREILARSEIEHADAERYWRARSGELRGEISVLDSQIDYLKSRLAETTETIYVASFATFGQAVPFGFSGRRGQGLSVIGSGGFGIRQPSRQLPGTVGNPQRQINGSFPFYPQGSIGFGGNGRHINSCFNGRCPLGAVIGYPIGIESLDRAAILARLDELESYRAGFQERWRILEDEARRAGAQPGWLRP